MSASTADVLARDRKLVELLDMYFAERQAGRTPNRDALLAAHPELAEELAASFDTLEFMFGCRVVDFAAVNGLEAFTERALGDYRLLREVGRGGMGVVYEAEQISLARRVALKVLPFAAMLDPRRLQRFKNEAQAAAALDHPNIVEVHGVGCERGVHFYVMRFVEGITLAELIQAKRSSSVSATQRTVLGKESKLEDGSLPAEPPHETQIAQLTTATSPQLQAAISTLIASAPKEQYCRKQLEATMPAENKDCLIMAAQRLVELYTAWNKPEEATKWRTELELIYPGQSTPSDSTPPGSALPE